MDIPDEWRCTEIVVDSIRCTFAAEKDGKCWLHRPHTRFVDALGKHVTLDRAAQWATIMALLWDILKDWHGQGDGISFKRRVASRIEIGERALREQDEVTLEQLALDVCVFLDEDIRIGQDGVNAKMVRALMESFANRDDAAFEEWLKRIVSLLKPSTKDAFRGTPWESFVTLYKDD